MYSLSEASSALDLGGLSLRDTTCCKLVKLEDTEFAQLNVGVGSYIRENLRMDRSEHFTSSLEFSKFVQALFCPACIALRELTAQPPDMITQVAT
jgi:hypothetical protein